MGGSAIRNEPATTALLEQYPVAYQIFEQAGWLHYFRRLQWYNEQQVLQFALNLQEDHSIVDRVRISVTEEDIAAVSGLPTAGARIFSRKHIIRGAQQNFFLPEEEIIFKGRGIQLSSLPPPWPGVAKFIKNYLTCEGRYQVVYQHELLLLSHLRHNRHVNIPYYLLGCLRNMVPYCRKAKEPTLPLTHHRLCQLLINRGFEQQNHPLINPATAAEFPHEQQQQNPPDVPELPHTLTTEPTSPARPPTITESSPTIAESSTSALLILGDDSEPEKSAYPTTRGRPLRKRKQASLFPPFLRKKRLRTSTRPPLMTPTLATPPIQLTPREPLTSPIPGSLPFSTMGAATQEPAGPSKIKTEPAETQEPAGPRIQKGIPTAKKDVQTLPTEGLTPPSQINPSTSREQFTQTLPGPTTLDVETQTSHLWDEHAEIQKWKKEYAKTQDQQLQVHRKTWRNHTFSNWEALDLTRQEVREVKKKNRDLKARMVKIFDLMHSLIATRKPSCNYSLFLIERLIWFQIKSIVEGKSHEVIEPTDFVKTFLSASTRDQHLLCEAYFHNEAIPENKLLNINPLVGDVQLRAFTSFLYNQILWQSNFSAAKHNEDNKLLWIRPKPERAARFISEYYEVLKKPGVTEHVQQLQSVVLQEC
jgi:hypothetical protein